MATDQSPPNERQSDLAVMEAQEFKQKRRLKRLLDAIEKVEEQANEAWAMFVSGEINHDAKNILIQRAVKEAVRESYKLLLDHQREQEEVDKNSEYWVGRRDDPIGVIQQYSTDDIGIYGLRDFLATQEFYQETVTRQVSRRNKPPGTETETVQHSVPEKISWRAFLRLKEFLDDAHDLEISFEELDDALPTWGFEEVPDEEGTERYWNDDGSVKDEFADEVATDGD